MCIRDSDTTIDLGDKASTRLDRTNSYSLDLCRLITDSRKSMYLLEIKGVDPLIPVESNDYDYYFGDYRTYAERSKVVIQSDIGIICKSSGDGELIVYTTDLVSACLLYTSWPSWNRCPKLPNRCRWRRCTCWARCARGRCARRSTPTFRGG